MASIIACEDTRQTQKLLSHFDIRKPLLSYHDHNEAARTAELIEKMVQGEAVALVSDAGTPLVSDPGFRLVKAAIEHGIPVVPVPGASAALAALTASGLPVDEFRFIGFIPPKSTARRKLFEELRPETATVLAYESPHRILESLQDMAAILEDRPIAVARELTKVHEEFLRGSAAEILAELSRRDSVKGELTIVIGKAARKVVPPEMDAVSEIDRLQREEGLDRMAAIKAVAKLLGLPKREVYRLSAGQDNKPPGRRRD